MKATVWDRAVHSKIQIPVKEETSPVREEINLPTVSGATVMKTEQGSKIALQNSEKPKVPPYAADILPDWIQKGFQFPWKYYTKKMCSVGVEGNMKILNASTSCLF